MSVVTLDRDGLEHARAVIARESATPQQEARFEWTARLTAATLVLLAAWGVTTLTVPFYQRVFLFGAALTCIIAVVLFALNMCFVWRLGRSFLAARRLGLHWRRPKWSLTQRAWLVCLAVVHLIGYPLLALGAFGLVEEIGGREIGDLLLAFSVVSFGAGCLFLLPLEVVRRRISAMTELRDALDSKSQADAGKVQVPARAYDRITDVEFEHTCVDSYRSLSNLADLEADTEIAVSLSPAFQHAVGRLPEAQADLVFDLVGDLDGRSELVSADRGTDLTLPVPGTTLQIRVRRYSGRNEIEVVSLETAPPHGGHSATAS